MKAIYYQRGETLDYIPEAAMEAGAVVPLGTRIGIADAPTPAGELGHIHVTGVFILDKAAEEIKMGAAVYYDSEADAITTTASTEVTEGEAKKTVGNVPAGYAVAAAPAADATVLVKLLG